MTTLALAIHEANREGLWRHAQTGQAANTMRCFKHFCSACPKAEFNVMDATSTPYADGHFDSIIDKSLIDTLVCAKVLPYIQTRACRSEGD